ncbi:MAG: DUF11 domain-containing protein [Anaerolineae bacterium]|nr:DUF11 domain-containing protein [Anaerolineae bacterium]
MAIPRPLYGSIKATLIMGLALTMVCSLLFFFAGLATPVIAAPLNTPVSGVIASDTIWTSVGNPYTVTGLVQVQAVLTIQPGVVVSFADGAQLVIETGGRLEAVGSAGQPIRFTAANPGSCAWEGIDLKSNDNTVRYAWFEYAKQAVKIETTSNLNTIEYNTFQQNGGCFADPTSGAIIGATDRTIINYNVFTNNQTAIYLSRSSRNRIEGNVISGTTQNGIYFGPTLGTPSLDNTILSNTVRYAGGYGIYLATGNINIIQSNQVYSNTAGGIRFEDQTLFGYIRNNDIYNNSGPGLYFSVITTTSSAIEPDLFIVENVLTNNQGGGIFWGPGSSPGGTYRFLGNVVCQNLQYSFLNTDTYTVPATPDWWGTNTPTIGAIGSGSEIQGSVNIDPRLIFTATPAITALPADGVSTTVITVSIQGGGSTVPARVRTVNLSTSLGTLSPVQVTLDANGVATTTLRSAPVIGTAIITATEICGYPVTTTVEFQATDVAVGKTSAPAQIVPGETVTYTIQYSNTTTVAATNVVITDTLPPGFQWVSDDAVPPFSRSFSGQNVIWAQPSLAGNVTGTITLVARLPQTATASCGVQLTNSVVITTATLDGNPTNNSASDGGVDVICADVTIDKEGPSGVLVPGQLITYTLTYSNIGQARANNVVITDVSPITGGVITLASGLTLNPGASGSISYPVTVPSSVCGVGTITNSAYIDTTTPESNNANNDDSFANAVSCADLVITKTATSVAVSFGRVTTFTIAYQNTGAYTATNVVITDVLDSIVNYITDTLGGAVTSTGLVTWNIGNVGPGASNSFDIGLQIDPATTCPPAGLTFTNTAQIGSGMPEQNTGDNISSDTVTIPCNQVDLFVLKNDGVGGPTQRPYVLAGDLITYTISYLNLGDLDASNVVLTETLPTYTTFVGPVGWNGGPAIYTYSVGNLAPMTGGVINFIVRVVPNLPAGVTVVDNQVEIGGSAPDDIPADNISYEQTPVQPAADLMVQKAGLTPVAHPGDLVTYAITVTNQGTLTATNVRITDTLPTSTTFQSNTVIGAPVSITTNTAIWDVGQIDPGQVISFNLTLQTDSGTAICSQTYLVNTVEARGTAPEGDYTNNIATTTSANSPVVACRDLIITKTVTSVPPSFGKVTTFTVTYQNAGLDPMADVVITDFLDSNVEYITDTLSGGVTTTNTIVWNLGTLAPGAAGSFEVGLRPITCSAMVGSVSFTNAVRIGSTTTEPYLPNNYSQAGPVTILCGQVDLVVVKNDGVGGPSQPQFVWAGDLITYTIAYVNAGDVTATGVVITETLPAYTEFVGPTETGGWFQVGSTNFYRYYPGVVSGTLGPREGDKLQFVVRVVPTLPPTVTLVNNLIEIGGNQPDAEPADNSSSEQTLVRARPDLHVEKVTLTPVVRPGQLVTYLITVTNQGAGAASNVVLTDILPAETTYVTDTLPFPVSGSGSGPISWNIDNVLDPLGGSRSFSLTLLAGADICLSDLVTNTIEARATELDANPADNVATATSGVGCRDVAITKVVDLPQANPGRQVVFTLAYSNPGLITATNTLITDVLPTGINFSQSSPVHAGPFGGAYEWNVGSVAPGLTGTIVITGQVSDNSTLCDQVLTNTASISAGFAAGQDQYLPNNQATATITVRCVPDLVVVKNDRVGGPAEPPFVQPGDVFTYSILYNNLGYGAASGVVLTETLPNNTTFVGPGGWTQVGTTNQYTYSLGTVPASGGSQVDFAVQVATVPAGGFITNTVCIGGSSDEVTFNNNCSFEQTLVTTNTPRLNVTKSATPSSGSAVAVGQRITYTVSVFNTGSVTASNVRITDTLPLSQVGFISATFNAGPVYGPNPLTATVASLAPSAGVTMTVVVTVSNVPTGTVFTNTAQAIANTLAVQDSLPVTHVVTSTIPITSNLVITKTTTPPSGSWVVPGGRITYTITVLNTGAGAENNVVVSDPLDANVTLVASSTTTGTISNLNPVRVTIPTLGGGQRMTVTLGVTVTGQYSGTIITNQASVTSTQTPLPQVSGVVTHVISSSLTLPSLGFAKSAMPPSGTWVNPGDTITYTIVVSNSGGAVTDVVITDTLPAGVGYVTGSATTTLGTIGFGSGRVTVTLPGLSGGAAMTASFRVTVTTDFTTTISNAGQMSSSQTVVTNSNVVTHPVHGTRLSEVYLPIIFKDYVPPSASLSWVAQDQDRVREVDGSDPQAFVADGWLDGAFLLTVNVGSGGAKTVANVRLESSQGPTAQWDTITNTVPVLGIFNGGVRLNNADGTINQIVNGQVVVTLYASDDLGSTRFPPDTYDYTVYVTFTDGSMLSATTRIPPIPPVPPAPGCDPLAEIIVGRNPRGVAIDETRNRVYVANYGSNSVSVVDSSSNTVLQTITGITTANGIAYDAERNIIWVTNYSTNRVTPIQADEGANNFTILTPITVGGGPWGVAVDPVHDYVYVVNNLGHTVSVIRADERTIVATLSGSFNQPFHVAANPVTGKVYVPNFGTHTIAVIDGTSVINTINLAVGDPSTQPYGVAVDEIRNLIYVTTVNSHRIVPIDGQTDTALPWAEFHRGWDPNRPVPLRAIAVNPTIPSNPPVMEDGGHVWATTSTSDGSEANQALLIPKGGVSYFHSPLACNVHINPTEGVAVNRALDRAFVTSGSNPGLLMVFNDPEVPPLVYLSADEDAITVEMSEPE